jgi:L-ascorbate metabolism protein UlaG (beta-lactamase superfamily)
MRKSCALLCAGLLALCGIANAGTTGTASTPAETAKLLQTPLAEKEAVVWYIGHHSYAIKTHSHLLLFDYYQMNEPSPAASLANGAVNPEEIKDLDVVVFASHRDGDHYDKIIWDWKKTVKKITYVLGWEPLMPQEKYVHIQPYETGKVGNIEVTTMPSTDSGESFLIKIDGLVIYHSGDNAFWMQSYRPRYMKEMDWIGQKTDHTDLLFINYRLGQDRPQLEEGLWYAVDKLNAKYVFPSHMLGADQQIKDLIKDAPTPEKRAKIVDKETRGETFLYKGGKIQ